jgi:hypothetical protein
MLQYNIIYNKAARRRQHNLKTYWNRVALGGTPSTWSDTRNRMKTSKFKILYSHRTWPAWGVQRVLTSVLQVFNSTFRASTPFRSRKLSCTFECLCRFSRQIQFVGRHMTRSQIADSLLWSYVKHKVFWQTRSETMQRRSVIQNKKTSFRSQILYNLPACFLQTFP